MSVFGYLKRKLKEHKERVEEGDTGFIIEASKEKSKTFREFLSGSVKGPFRQDSLKEEGKQVSEKPRIRKRTKEEGIRLAETIYEDQLAKQKKEMLEETRAKKRAKGRYGGRRVKEQKAIPRYERAEQRHLEYMKKPKEGVAFQFELENESLPSAKYFAKTKLKAVRVEEEYKVIHKDEEPIHIFHFYDKDNYHVANYFPESKWFTYVDPKDIKKDVKESKEWEEQEVRKEEGVKTMVTRGEDPELQRFTQKLIRHRFPDRPSLLSIKVRKGSKEVLGGAGGCTVLDSSLPRYGGINIILSDEFKTGSGDAKNILTHEFTHQRRFMEGEHKLGYHRTRMELKGGRIDPSVEADKEEIETELESIQRGTIVDFRTGLMRVYGGYWGEALGRNWRDFQLQDYKTLTKKEPPKDYFSLVIPSTRKITQNIALHKRDTNFWFAGVRRGGLKEIFPEGDEEKVKRKFGDVREEGRLNMIIGRAEDIDTNYVTSEGDYLHAYAPSGKIKPLKLARFLDRSDGVTGEEDVFQILDRGKKLLISDKDTPDRIVKPIKKQKPFGFVPKFKPLGMPTFNIPFISKPKTKQKKKVKKSKDPITDVLSFKFFK